MKKAVLYKYTYNEQQRLTTVATLADKTIASYTYDENGLRLTKTIGDTTHEYFYNNEVLEMEVVKGNDVITEYRSYKWSGYTPLSMIVKAKNDAGEFDTKAYQFITNHRGDVLIKEHRLKPARPVQTSMDLTSCEAVIVKIKK